MMIYNIVKYNLKKHRKIHTLYIMGIAVLITLTMIGAVNHYGRNSVNLGDLLLLIYGGDLNNPGQVSALQVMMFLTPHLIIIYFTEMYFIRIVEETPRFMFLRLGKLTKWSVGVHISIFFMVLKYYFVLYVASAFTVFIYIGKGVFTHANLAVGSINGLTSDVNQTFMIFMMFLISVLSIISIILIANNIYFYFKKNDKAIIVVILCNIIVMFLSSFSETLNKLTIFNQLAIKKHNIFTQGIESFTFGYSIIYLAILILINLSIRSLIIKKLDF